MLVGNSTNLADNATIHGNLTGLTSITIHAETVTVGTTSHISVIANTTGQAPGSTNSNTGLSGGGSHGGSAGAQAVELLNPPYGSYYYPSSPGSSGGSFIGI